MDGEQIVNLLTSQIEDEYKATMRALQSNAKPDSLVRMRAHIGTLARIRRHPHISVLDPGHLQNRVVAQLGLLVEEYKPEGSTCPTGKHDVEKLIDELKKK